MTVVMLMTVMMMTMMMMIEKKMIMGLLNVVEQRVKPFGDLDDADVKEDDSDD